MTYHADIHHRRSLRLSDYDYSQAGAYFVTICTEDREYVFGDVVGGEMRLNTAGSMIQGLWKALPERFPSVELDEAVIMPNHIHGIVVFVGARQLRPVSVSRSVFRLRTVCTPYPALLSRMI